MAKQYRLLVDERAYWRREMKAMLDRTEGRPLTDAESQWFDAADARLNECLPLLERHENARAAILSAPSIDLPPTGGNGPSAGPRYAQMFSNHNHRGGGRGFNSLTEFMSGLQAGLWDARYEALVSEGDPGSGGLLVPEQFAAELFDLSLEGEIVRPRARIEPMMSDTKRIAGFKVGQDGAPFGISGGWASEGETIATADPKTRAVKLTANKLAALVQISNEAAADGTSTDAQLTTALTRGLGWLLDHAFLRGTGAGQPLGILNAPATVTVAAETGQAAGTILYDNIAKMFARLHPASHARAVWVANSTAIPQLLTLSVPVGTGGSHIPVLTESGGVFRMLTLPVVFSEKASALGAVGDIMLADFSQYAVGLRAELIVEKSMHVGFATDTTYYRAKLRADGQPTWDEPYDPAFGETLSPFVTLAARA
jgi:HK97 family phage major capsid protein